MLHQLQANMKGDIQETIESSLNTHLSPFKSTITAEISQHDDLSRATWIGQLEEILERYLVSQRLVLTPSPGPPPDIHQLTVGIQVQLLQAQNTRPR
jgi:hypothetical protein